ncbi:MAG: hypothetical protein AMXMBFR74_09140 [Parvibaculum sp.]|uniref:hypothetical protein n=1 Tax=Parvibaculum sp. TaxID=2024848 RepID=UPI0035BA1E0F
MRSSSKSRGKPPGRKVSRRATILDPQGQSHLMAVGALYGLKRIAGLGPAPLGAGAALLEIEFTMGGFGHLAPSTRHPARFERVTSA